MVKCSFLCNQQARTWLIFVLAAACCFISWFIAYVGPFWLNQTLRNQVLAACPNHPDQGQGVALTVCLAEAEKQFPRSWQAPYRNWVALLSAPNAVFSEELSWRWRRKKDEVCSHWFLHGGRCLSTTGTKLPTNYPQRTYIEDFRGNQMIISVDRCIVIKKKALASHSACFLVLSRLFPPVLSFSCGHNNTIAS